MKKWIFGAYRRRSFDERNDGESNSVINQKKIIEDHLVDKSDIIVYKYYVDDGYTGTDFNRPGYKEMLNDIKKGKINGVIVKDLSRLGRNYIEVGNFIEEIIPEYGLRFISVNDNVDSYIDSNIMDSLEIPFKNLMNESYSKDSSKKMRTSLKSSKKSGNYIGKIAPYGYLKDPDDSHKLIVDKEAADNVKKIFLLALKGNSKQEIIKELKDNHILTPSVYLKTKYGIKVSKISDNWNTKMLDGILKNETYIGNLVQGKRTRISHKTHNMVRVAEDDWIIVEDKHKAIIKEEIFNQVQDIFYNRNVRVNKKGIYYKYTGFIKCPDCGNNLYRMSRVKKQQEQVYYYCSSYIKTKQCSKHYILEKELDEIVLECINKHIELINELENKINDVVSFSKIDYNLETKKIRKAEIEVEKEKYKKLLDELVKDYKCDYITENDFDDFKEKYLFEINRLNIELEDLSKEKINSYNLEWIEKFKDIKRLEKIDRNVVDSFISNIYVNDDKSIDIDFRYNEQYKIALEYLKNTKNMI